MEYMKYRAPAIWIDRALSDKLDQLESVEKEKNAADGQLQFERKMDGLQKIFDKIKNLVVELHNRVYEGIWGKDQFDAWLMFDAEPSYEEITMLAVALHCMQNDAANATRGGNQVSLMKEMVDLQWSGDNIDAGNASKIIRMIIISNSIDDPGAILEGISPGSEEYQERQKLMEEYEAAQENMADGIKRTEERLDSLVKNVYDDAHGQYELAKRGLEICDEIDELLGELEDEIKNLQDAYKNWENAVSELPDDALSKEEYVKNLYDNNFFDETEGMLPDFRQLIEDNRTYFTQVRDQLDELTFVGTPLHQISSKGPIMDEADYGLIQSETEIKAAGWNLMMFYNDIGSMNLSIDKKNIDLANVDLKGYAFIEKLEEYCDIGSADEAAAEAATEKWDDEMESSSSSLEDMILSTDIVEVNLNNYDLPSAWIKYGKTSGADSGGDSAFEDFDGTDSGLEDFDGPEGETTISGGLDDDKREDSFSSGHRNLTTDDTGMASISGLPAKLLEAGETVAEPLIMTEYVMGMFSHYTSKYDGYEHEVTNPLSITDNDLSEHVVYRAEIEYILWGRPEARDNVTITKSIIFAVNLIFNLSFAFTNPEIRKGATQVAALFPVGALAKIAIKCALQTMVAMIETVKNMEIILKGGAVPLIKHLGPTWETYIPPYYAGNGYDHETGFTYEDYVWIMVCVKMFASPQTMLARTADCIELNMTKTTSDNSLKDMYTMIDLEASVSIDTFFLPKLNGAGYDVQTIDDDTYTIDYYGIQGY